VKLLKAAVCQLESSLSHREQELSDSLAFLRGRGPAPPTLEWAAAATTTAAGTRSSGASPSKLRELVARLQHELRLKQDEVLDYLVSTTLYNGMQCKSRSLLWKVQL
jgi:hypothetical protein